MDIQQHQQYPGLCPFTIKDQGPFVQNLTKLLANKIQFSILKYGKHIDTFC